MKNKVLYFIPARGGSKGLPGKNIKKLNGRPLIEYSILAAKKSKIKGDIVVSTDDPKIARVAKKGGANVPYLRPEHLSTDKAKTLDALFHHLVFAASEGKFYDTVILLQPTSPLRKAEDIENGYNLFLRKKASAVIGVTEFKHSLSWVNDLPADGRMDKFIKSAEANKNRQQLGKKYQINGALYVLDIRALYKYKRITMPKSFAYVMPEERSVDIDSLLDFRFAEFLLKKK